MSQWREAKLYTLLTYEHNQSVIKWVTSEPYHNQVLSTYHKVDNSVITSFTHCLWYSNIIKRKEFADYKMISHGMFYPPDLDTPNQYLHNYTRVQ